MNELLNRLDMRPVDPPPGLEPGDLYPTHAGQLVVGGRTLKVFVLSDGRRVIDGADLEAFFAGEDAARD